MMEEEKEQKDDIMWSVVVSGMYVMLVIRW